MRLLLVISICFTCLVACDPPAPPPANVPTSPAVLEITPAPTLDIDATATAFANQLRPSPTPVGLYIVQDGDTLSSLAEEFNTTVEEIMATNDILEPESLQIGQELIIPSMLPTPISDDGTPAITDTQALTETTP